MLYVRCIARLIDIQCKGIALILVLYYQGLHEKKKKNRVTYSVVSEIVVLRDLPHRGDTEVTRSSPICRDYCLSDT